MKHSHALRELFRNWHSVVACGLFLIAFSLLLVTPTRADTVDELKSKIEERNQQLQELEEEIARYEEELTKVGADRATLEKEISRLDLSRRKIATDIAVTENRIETADLELSELDTEIQDKERRISESKVAIEKSLRNIAKIDDVPLVEHFLAGSAFSDAWEAADQLRRVQTALGDEVVELEAIRDALESDYREVAEKQGELVSFRKELSGQKSVLDQNRNVQSSILTTTKNKESEFQRLLDEKLDARQQLEAELRDFEAELEYTLDPSTIPSPGSGTLIFPLAESYMQRCDDKQGIYGNLYCLTQYFGNTQFAQSGAYNGKGHNGIDFGAPVGTKVVSSRAGIVMATGDTDQYRGCYSYGKWIVVEHSNGLATLYAHLSHISVVPGEAVAKGGLIGYSGNTGYSTGPHLHFSVYVSDAVRIVRLGDIKTRTNCAEARIPVAPTQGYLNPLSYL